MHTPLIPKEISVRVWLIRAKGIARLERRGGVDVSNLWDRMATPDTMIKLIDMVQTLATVPDCPHYAGRLYGLRCRKEAGKVKTCTECKLEWAEARGGKHGKPQSYYR